MPKAYGEIANRQNRVPSLTDGQGFTEHAQTVRDILEVREGQRGDPLDAFVTWRALNDAGVARMARGDGSLVPASTPKVGIYQVRSIGSTLLEAVWSTGLASSAQQWTGSGDSWSAGGAASTVPGYEGAGTGGLLTYVIPLGVRADTPSLVVDVLNTWFNVGASPPAAGALSGAIEIAASVRTLLYQWHNDGARSAQEHASPYVQLVLQMRPRNIVSGATYVNLQSVAYRLRRV